MPILETARRTQAALATLTLLSGAALAGQITHIAEFPLSLTNWQTTLSIPKFDDSAYPLESVFIRFESNIEGSIGVENLSRQTQDLTATLQATMRLLAPDGTTELIASQPSAVFDIPPLGPNDGTLDFGGTSGFTTPTLTDSEIANLAVPPRGVLTLADFVGTGNIVFPASAQGSSFFTGNTGNEASLFQLRAGCRLVVTYNFTPPEDPCRPNTADVPGSLLLFPRFDSRPGNLTLITVTNTNCDFTPEGLTLFAGTVDVEFVYIGRFGTNGEDLPCLEHNTTRRLTPCDTITLTAAADNPNQQRGFLYAFAKDPLTGAAIVFNHLIGQAAFFTGGNIDDPLRDALNARPFLGIGNHRAPTDHDADGIRDLDGLEYSEAPDEILVPRYLGQDQPAGEVSGTFESRLVLVGLSGGAQFTTQVFILNFNDNEEAFSAQYTFRCWDEPLLSDIDGSFRESFLDTTNNAPLEILGADDQESGWIRVDGQIAFSSADAISDPAIYAVLFERYGNYVVCDLPWELCTQANGDLFPNGVIAED